MVRWHAWCAAIVVIGAAVFGSTGDTNAQTYSICPTAKQRTVIATRLICRGGVWHRIRLKDWKCPDGIIAKEVQLADQNTGTVCFPVNFCNLNNATSVILAKRECRAGFWHVILTEEWICSDGRVLSSVELSDRETTRVCVQPRD